MIEIFFGIITRQAIRRGTFTSVKDLTTIGTFIDAHNDRCQSFSWTKDADESGSPHAVACSSRPWRPRPQAGRAVLASDH